MSRQIWLVEPCTPRSAAGLPSRPSLKNLDQGEGLSFTSTRRDQRQEGPLSQVRGMRPVAEDLVAVGLAPEWDQLLISGLSTELVETSKLTFRHQWRELEMIVAYGKTEREWKCFLIYVYAWWSVAFMPLSPFTVMCLPLIFMDILLVI